MKKNWYVEIEDGDNNKRTLRNPFSSPVSAIQKAVTDVQDFYSEFILVTPEVDSSLVKVYKSLSGFVTVTVFHVDSVYYK